MQTRRRGLSPIFKATVLCWVMSRVVDFSSRGVGRTVKDLLKLASAVSGLPVPLVGFLIAMSLLFERVVSFDQALLLVFVAVGLHYIIGKKESQKLRRVESKKPVASIRPTKRNSLPKKIG
jgi:hypothetical protein